MDRTQKKDRRFFSILYRTRLRASKNGETVINLSLLFSIIALLTAPWLVIFGGLAALMMGYRFSIDRNGLGFEQNFDDVVQDAARRVRQTVESVTEQH